MSKLVLFLLRLMLPKWWYEEVISARELRLKKDSGHWSPLLDYSFTSKSRYGHGQPTHPELHEIISHHRATYIEHLTQFKSFLPKLETINFQEDPNSEMPSWSNRFLEGLDPISLYCFLAIKNPRYYIEVGSGNSTKFARKAIQDHQLQTKVISIDPFPRAEIDRICDENIRIPLEEYDLAILDELDENDIVFIDGSHRSFTNSDVTIVFLEVLPKLKPGTLIYFDDIYLPDDYPPEWKSRYYSEQYLLATLMLYSDKFKPVLPSRFISQDSEIQDQLIDFRKMLQTEVVGGNGFWICKT